jgi:hypothetical protein
MVFNVIPLVPRAPRRHNIITAAWCKLVSLRLARFSHLTSVKMAIAGKDYDAAFT